MNVPILVIVIVGIFCRIELGLARQWPFGCDRHEDLDGQCRFAVIPRN